MKFNKIVDKLFMNKHLNVKDSDDAKLQFEDFVTNIGRQHHDEFLNFDFVSHRLDDFYAKYLHKNDKFLWKVCIFAFTLSHGQSQIERGFGINKEIVIENLETTSLCAQRLICDHIASSKQEIHEIDITNTMVTACKSAHLKYTTALEAAKKEREDGDKNRKRKLLAVCLCLFRLSFSV